MAIWALVGCAGMVFAGIRYLAALFHGEPKIGHIEEDRYQIALLLAGAVILVVAGIIPGPYITWMSNLLQGYANLF